MNLNDYDYERIERYLLQEMDAAEQQAFEADCQANPDLAAALQKEKQVHLLIRIHNQSMIRQQIRTLDAATKTNETARPPIRSTPFLLRRRVILLVGSIAAVLLVSIGFFWQLNGIDEDALFGKTRGETPDQNPALSRLAKAEGEGNWQQVEQLYADLPDSLQGKLYPTLQVARAKYKLKKYAEAADFARKVMGDSTTATEGIRCHAKLLLVLIYRDDGKPQEAKALIKKAEGDSWDCLSAEQREELKQLSEELP